MRKEIGPIAAPDLIQWAPGLPKTRSGKIMRRILRKIAENEYSNLGDISTLADPAVVQDLIDNRMNRRVTPAQGVIFSLTARSGEREYPSPRDGRVRWFPPRPRPSPARYARTLSALKGGSRFRLSRRCSEIADAAVHFPIAIARRLRALGAADFLGPLTSGCAGAGFFSSGAVASCPRSYSPYCRTGRPAQDLKRPKLCPPRKREGNDALVRTGCCSQPSPASSSPSAPHRRATRA